MKWTQRTLNDDDKSQIAQSPRTKVNFSLKPVFYYRLSTIKIMCVIHRRADEKKFPNSHLVGLIDLYRFAINYVLIDDACFFLSRNSWHFAIALSNDLILCIFPVV